MGSLVHWSIKVGKSSISFRNRADINLDVLREMIEHAGKIVTTEI